MGPLTLLALLTGALAIGMVDDGDSFNDTDDTDADLPDEEDPPTKSPASEDLGATFDFDEDANTVTLDIGEDETGALATIIYANTQDVGDPDDFVDTYEARFYLVPEGVDLSDAGFEDSSEIPGQQEFGGSPSNYLLEDFESHFELELLGTVDLDFPEPNNLLPEQGTMRDVLPDITTNADFDVHYLEANTDTDDLVTFLNEDYIVTRNGVAEQVVTEDTTGTAGADWLSAGGAGLALDGGEGDDTLTTDFADTTLTGGTGDDTFEGVFAESGQGFLLIDGTEPSVLIDAGDGDDTVRTSNATVDAGNGDDEVNLFGGEARGGDGEDTLRAGEQGLATLHGDAGDDNLIIGGEGSEAFGGEGADFIGVSAGALGDGGAGDDRLQVEEGGTGIGGAGEDLFTVWNLYDDEDGPATVTGGEGADTINALVRNAFGTPESLYLEITDFDTTEDVLQIGSFNGADITNIDIVQNPDDNVTDIRVSYAAPSNLEPGTAIIRIDGLSDITEDQIVIIE